MQNCQRPLATAKAVFNFRIHRITKDDPERPEGIDNYSMGEVRGDFVRPPHNQFMSATVDMNNCLLICSPRRLNAIEE